MCREACLCPTTPGKSLQYTGRTRKSAWPGANGVVKLSPCEFLDRFDDLVPPPHKHRHCYHGAEGVTDGRATPVHVNGTSALRQSWTTDGHA